MDIEDKIKYAGLLARVFVFFACMFIGGALVVHVMIGGDTNPIAETGLVFLALFGVFAWMKRKLELELNGEPTFHNQGSG
jgi:hypothetical protein